MKLKYYMRGLGIGILITTIVLSVGNKKEKLSNKEIMSKAIELGMVMKEDDNEDYLKKVLENSLDKEGAGLDLVDNDLNEPIDEENGADFTEPSDEDNDIDSYEQPSVEDNGADIQDPSNEDNDIDAYEPSDVETEQDIQEPPDEDTDIDAHEPSDEDAEQDIQEPPDEDTDIEAHEPSNEDANTETGLGIEEPIDEDNGLEVIDPSQVTFIIVKGMSSRQISELLAEKGLFEDAVDFDDYIKRQGKAGYLRTGTYTLPKDSAYQVILNTIVG